MHRWTRREYIHVGSYRPSMASTVQQCMPQYSSLRSITIHRLQCFRLQTTGVWPNPRARPGIIPLKKSGRAWRSKQKWGFLRALSESRFFAKQKMVELRSSHFCLRSCGLFKGMIPGRDRLGAFRTVGGAQSRQFSLPARFEQNNPGRQSIQPSHLLLKLRNIHVLLEQGAQWLDIFAVHVLHVEAQPAGFHVLQVGVKFQFP